MRILKESLNFIEPMFYELFKEFTNLIHHLNSNENNKNNKDTNYDTINDNTINNYDTNYNKDIPESLDIYTDDIQQISIALEFKDNFNKITNNSKDNNRKDNTD